FFFQAEDGIRAFHVTGVQTCALPISRDGVERLALAGRLDLPGAQQRENEQAHHFEVPAERLLRELVGEVAAARGVPVVGALLDRSEERRVGKGWRSRGSPSASTESGR